MQEPFFIVRGTVIAGLRYGRVLGFPTANLDRKEYAKMDEVIPSGIYAGLAKLLSTNKVFRAGIVIGPNEDDGLPKIEAHLLDFSGDLYGQELELSLMVYLRPYQNFKGEDVLKEQIGTDIEAVRRAVVL